MFKWTAAVFWCELCRGAGLYCLITHFILIIIFISPLMSSFFPAIALFHLVNPFHPCEFNLCNLCLFQFVVFCFSGLWQCGLYLHQFCRYFFLSFWHLPASTPSSLALHFPVLNKCHCYTAAAERITTLTELDDVTAQPRRMSVKFTSRPVWGISYSHFLFLHPPACDPQMPSWRMSEIMKCISRWERACWRGNERMYGCVLCGRFSTPMT